MPDDKDSADWKPPDATLSADGQLEGRLRRLEAPAAPPKDEPIELAQRPPPRPFVEQGPWRPVAPDPRRRWAVRLAIAAVATGLLLLGLAVLASRLTPVDQVRTPNFVEKLLPRGPVPPLVIDSEPSGAEISVNGKLLGLTPWAGENQWAGDNELVVTRPGFAPWRKKFRGRQELHLTAKLKPQ